MKCPFLLTLWREPLILPCLKNLPFTRLLACSMKRCVWGMWIWFCWASRLTEPCRPVVFRSPDPYLHRRAHAFPSRSPISPRGVQRTLRLSSPTPKENNRFFRYPRAPRLRSTPQRCTRTVRLFACFGRVCNSSSCRWKRVIGGIRTRSNQSDFSAIGLEMHFCHSAQVRFLAWLIRLSNLIALYRRTGMYRQEVRF